MSAARYRLLFIICLSLVVYGSLVPLNYVPKNFDDATERFVNIPWLRLGATARADWIANIILYIPVSFLLISALSQGKSRSTPTNAVLTMVFCSVMAVCVEFAQIYFPPRTVSLNDLLAEFLGAAAGVIVWIVFGGGLSRWRAKVSRRDHSAIESSLWAYLLIYLLLGVFPFDFVVSAQELLARLRSDTTGIIFAPGGCNGLVRCAFKPVTEILLTIPIGILLAGRKKFQHASWLMPVAVGLMFGVVVELSQVLIWSGVSQGLSALSKSLGIVAGYVFTRNSELILGTVNRIRPKFMVCCLIGPYLIALLVANKWLHADWVTPVKALENLSNVHFLPFYYHYYTTETVAVVSLLFNGLLYSPVGLAAAFVQKHMLMPIWWPTALIAASLAFAIEGAKLFHAGTHADPTNIIIAVAFAVIMQLVGLRLLPVILDSDRKTQVEQDSNELKTLPKTKTPAVSDRKAVYSWRTLVGLVFIGISAWSLLEMPVAMGFLLLMGAGLLLAQFLFPFAWLYALPVIIIVLDVTPWSGRFFWDESDALLLAVAGGLLVTNAPRRALRGKGSKLLVYLLMMSWAAAALMPVIPVPEIGMNSFNNYYGGFNSLRVGKGFFWALVFMPFLSIIVDDQRARIAFLRGLLVGAALLAGWVIVERQLFSGLINLSSDFRVTAALSTMHTGGGHLETFLVILFPCVVCWTLLENSRWRFLLGPAVLLALGYALLVTYARAGYAAFLVSIVLMGLLFAVRSQSSAFRSGVVKSSMFVVAVGGLFVFLLAQSSFVQQRMGTSWRDLNIRLNHWGDSIRLMDQDVVTRIFGMGLGQYPMTYAYRNPEGERLAYYKFSGTQENPYLDLAAGDNLYYEQIIALRPDSDYTLSLDVKSTVERGKITTPICEKAMLYSFQCKWITLSYEHPGSEWRTLVQTFNSGNIGRGDVLAARPIKFSFYNPTRNSIVSVDNISLKDADGVDLIRNGTFTQTSDHWFFSTDNHLPWHIKQLGVQIYFSQGWVGLVIFIVFLLSTLIGLLKSAVDGDVFSVMLVSSVVAFVAVGVFSSPFDAPRLTLTFFSLMFIARYQIGSSSKRRSVAGAQEHSP